MYDYIHFQWNDSTVFKDVEENLLADHFDLYLILFSPLSLLFKTYTLLIVQILAILSGGLGIYKYFFLTQKGQSVGLYAVLYFFLFYGVFAALAFDYHSNVVAAAQVPWFFYLLKRKNLLGAGILLLFILISKENVSLWMSFVSLGLAIEYWNDIRIRNYLLLCMVACLGYFFMITSFVMPALSTQKHYEHFNYSFLGEDPLEAIKTLILSPIGSFKTLFINHTGHPFGEYVKLEFHLITLISGLFILFRKPQYLLMLIPIYFQKLYNDNYVMWSVSSQYSIELAPIMAIGIFEVLSGIKKRRSRRVLSIAVLIATLSCTIRIMDYTEIHMDRSRMRIYQARHYTKHYDVGVIKRELNKLPKGAVVSAQSPFLSQLSYRDKIYQFPMIKNAEYVVYSSLESPYPLDRDAFSTYTNELEGSEEWDVFFSNDHFKILKRN